MPLPALYTYLDGYANPVTFSESEEVSHYVQSINGTAELTEDPLDTENKVLNLHDANKGYLWVGSFFQGTGDTDTLKMSFDFYDANGNSAYEFIRLVTDSNKQPVITLFKDGYLKYGEEDINIIGDDGQPFAYEANKWYSITFEANWLQNYVKMGFKEKGAESYRYATMPFFAHFIKCDQDRDWLSQIRIGYSSISADDVSFYIDNYSHSAAPEAVPAVADEVKAVYPREVKTEGVITGIKTHVMTTSGQEKTAKLLVMIFDEEENISKVRVSEDVTCSTVTGEPITIDLTGDTFTTYKAFVWSGSNSLTPIDTIEAYKW